MKRLTVCFCLLLALPTLFAASEKNRSVQHGVTHRYDSALPISVQDVFNLRDYGAIGDGITDDGPALQRALSALAQAGGGTLFVPEGRYAIITLVTQDFTGLDATVVIQGVASSAVVPPPNSNALELTRGLSLVSEFAPKTGAQQLCIKITGLRSFLMKDIGFIGTPNVLTDAWITLDLEDIWEARIQHCEFYGLSSQVAGGAIVRAVRSDLTIEETEFLGSFCNSGQYTSVVQNVEWKGITVAETIFVDYGQRPELYGKSSYGAALSWVNIGNAAAPQSDSPRREAVFRNVFLDEGGYFGLTSLTYLYQPASAPVDLVYISGLYMNVSNFGTTGHYLWGLDRVLIEKSHYGWSHNAESALHFLGVGNAIVDNVECVAASNRILANSVTKKLTVINSVYTALDSLAQTTKVINTTPEEDPVQFVRQAFMDKLDRDPDPAAHFYWSDRILQCGDNAQCVTAERAALAGYLNAAPTNKFSITGQITDEGNESLAGVTITLTGSQSTQTQTDINGRYSFSGLPTSGVYTITPTRVNYTFTAPAQTITTPSGDRTVNFAATLNRYTLSGRVLNAAGQGILGATVSLSGSQAATVTTDDSGAYSFTVLAEGNYTITASRTNYTVSPAVTFNNLGSNHTANFTGTLVSYTLSGRVINDGGAFSGVTVSLSGAESANVISGTDGKWSFVVPAEGDYTVTPSLNHYTFLTQQATFRFLSANQNVDFQATLNRHTISGRVTKADGSGFPGTTMTLSGAQTATTTTDASGNYAFANLPAGRDYVVAPSRSNYAFAPATANFNDLSTDQTLNVMGGLVSYTLSGRISGSGKELGGVTVTLSGSQSAAAITDVKGHYSFKVPAEGNYTITPSKTNYLFSPASTTFNLLSVDHAADFDGSLQRLLEFSEASFSASETARTIAVTVTRTGDTSEAAEVVYSAGDGSAHQRSDVIPIIGKLSFQPGETSKSFIILITDDTYVEGNESLTLRLTEPVGDTLDTNSTATLTIVDNDTNAAAPNAIDDAQFFVRQHYRDFLNRRADEEGLAFWSNQILSCGTDTACIADRRMNVSAAFFLSIEFQDTGFLVYRLYQAAYAQPPQHLEEFLLDTRAVAEGITVGTPGWQELLAANKASFIKGFVERPTFETAYPSQLTPIEFVNQLNSTAGNVLSVSEVSAALAEFGGAPKSENIDARARVLLRVAEHQSFSQRQINPAFVLMQYFGYLQRNPYELPDTNLDGYAFWLQKLESFGGDFRRAEMVKAFLLSAEYRSRFGAP